MPLTGDAPPASIEERASRFAFLGIVVFLTFWMRYFLADRNSYWLDELYSVERYVVQYDSVVDAIRALAETSIHPPLYQFVLFYWVELFGDGETATRTLSNIYMALAVVFLHRFVARVSDERLANAVAIVFALTHVVIYYGLETRSYAQTLMLATASSFALLAYLLPHRSASSERVPAWLRTSWALTLFTAANAGLLLTHYYNFFFWGAQILFVTMFIVASAGVGHRVKRLVVVGSVYVLQFAIFLVIWGQVAIESYQRNTGRYAADSITNTPLEILGAVAAQNFTLEVLSGPLSLLAAVALLVAATVRNWRTRAESQPSRELVGIGYCLMTTVGPAAILYLAFLTIGAERFTVRYVLYIVPGLTFLLALAIRELFTSVAALGQHAAPEAIWWRRLQWFSPTLVGVVLLMMVMPDSMRAAGSEKADWRGTAQGIVAIVESNPDESYVIYEPAFRSTPVYDYYLSRYSDEIRVRATIRRWVERREEGGYSFERDAEFLEEHDYLLIPFVHHRVTNFPRALELLEETYEIHHWQIDEDGKGIVIFALD